MARHARQYWPPNRGRVKLSFNWDAIHRGSVVHVSASEYVPETPTQGVGHGDHRRVVGAANITVANVSPHGAPDHPNQGVTFVVNIDWPEPIPIVTDITVFDEEPVASIT